jgi:hypothetical protein
MSNTRDVIIIEDQNSYTISKNYHPYIYYLFVHGFLVQIAHKHFVAYAYNNVTI